MSVCFVYVYMRVCVCMCVYVCVCVYISLCFTCLSRCLRAYEFVGFHSSLWGQAAAHAAEWPVADELLALLGAALRRTAAPRDDNAALAGTLYRSEMEGWWK